MKDEIKEKYVNFSVNATFREMYTNQLFKNSQLSICIQAFFFLFVIQVERTFEALSVFKL